MKIQLKVGRLATRGSYVIGLFFEDRQPIVSLQLTEPRLNATWIKHTKEQRKVAAGKRVAFKDRGVTSIVILTEMADPPQKLDIHGMKNGKSFSGTAIAGPFADEDRWVLEILQSDGYVQRPTSLPGGRPSGRQERKAGTAAPANSERRFIGRPVGQIAKPCVLDVLRLLIEDSGNIVHLSSYETAGVANKDPQLLDPSVRTMRVLGYRSHPSRFNFGLLALRDAKVILPERFVAVDRRALRTYHVIRDGRLVATRFHASLSRYSWMVLNDWSTIQGENRYDATRLYAISLEGLPLVRRPWADVKTQRLVELLQERMDLQAETKELSRRHKRLLKENPALQYTFPPNRSRIPIHRGLGIKQEPKRTYDTAHVAIRLMGYKPPRYDYATFPFGQVDARLTSVRRRFTSVSFLIRAIVFAAETFQTKMIPWDAGKHIKRGETEKLEQLAEFEGATLKRVAWTQTVLA